MTPGLLLSPDSRRQLRASRPRTARYLRRPPAAGWCGTAPAGQSQAWARRQAPGARAGRSCHQVGAQRREPWRPGGGDRIGRRGTLAVAQFARAEHAGHGTGRRGRCGGETGTRRTGGRSRVVQRVQIGPAQPRRIPVLVRYGLVGQPHQGGQAAGGSRAKPDPDAVPGGQPGDHEQAHPAGDRDIDYRRVIKAPVGVRHLLGTHAHALVGDIKQDATAAQQVTGDRDRGLGG